MPACTTRRAPARGYAVSGGVAGAIEKCIEAYYPDTKVNIQHVEGLEDCRKVLLLAKLGKLNGSLIEGMGCPGGCVAGAGTTLPSARRRISSKRRSPVRPNRSRPKNLPKCVWNERAFGLRVKNGKRRRGGRRFGAPPPVVGDKCFAAQI